MKAGGFDSSVTNYTFVVQCYKHGGALWPHIGGFHGLPTSPGMDLIGTLAVFPPVQVLKSSDTGQQLVSPTSWGSPEVTKRPGRPAGWIQTKRLLVHTSLNLFIPL